MKCEYEHYGCPGLLRQLWPQETTEAILTALRCVVAEFGVPLSLYNDRASWAFYTPKAGEKVSKTELTQVGRALDELGVEHIPAYSPQARGRSERVNRTLQDRPVNELKAAGIRDAETANRFIRETYVPAHNQEFGHGPKEAMSSFISAAGTELEGIFCVKEKRVVSNDNVVRYDNRHPDPLRHRFLHYLAVAPNRPHQTPVCVRLVVFPPPRES
jgi:hypothetical protein